MEQEGVPEPERKGGAEGVVADFIRCGPMRHKPAKQQSVTDLMKP